MDCIEKPKAGREIFKRKLKGDLTNMDIFAEQQYIVERLDGDYAYLKNLNSPEDDLKCVARALLPEVGEGSKLRYEMMSYEIME